MLFSGREAPAAEIFQIFAKRINKSNGIISNVSISINSARKSDGITLEIVPSPLALTYLR